MAAARPAFRGVKSFVSHEPVAAHPAPPDRPFEFAQHAARPKQLFFSRRTRNKQASMNWLKKLPGFERSAPGLEWKLLRLLPRICVAGTLLPLSLAVAARLFLTADTPAALERRVQMLDYLLLGLVFSAASLVLTVTIGCVIVWLMKGPAYVADGFEVSHSDQPLP